MMRILKKLEKALLGRIFGGKSWAQDLVEKESRIAFSIKMWSRYMPLIEKIEKEGVRIDLIIRYQKMENKRIPPEDRTLFSLLEDTIWALKPTGLIDENKETEVTNGWKRSYYRNIGRNVPVELRKR